MRVLSWDVGIKNLAYCVLTFDNNLWNIHKWDKIDISCNENTVINTCWMCKKPPKHYYITDDKEYYLCGKHKTLYKQVDYVFDEMFIDGDENKKEICCNNCKVKPKYKYLNKCYCTTHAKKTYKNIVSNSMLKPISKKTSVMKTSIDVHRFELIKRLESLPELLKVDYVLIENQPTFKNPTMKSLSCTIYDYYMIRGIFDKIITQSTITNIKYMSPSNKLKLNENNTIEVLNKTSDGNKYKITKQLAIEYCKNMIKHDTVNTNILLSHKKKDDLCDAFLQGAYYLSKHP
jgi:hypothetical protein